MKSTVRAHSIIKNHEGLSLEAYLCPAGKWTIGWGHTAGVKPGMKISLDRAKQLFLEDIKVFEDGVTSLLTRPVTQEMFDALVSFAFNTGLDIDADTIAEGLGDATLLRLVNEGKYIGASREFEKWVYGGRPPKRLPGLVKRRAAERDLFLGKWKV